MPAAEYSTWSIRQATVIGRPLGSQGRVAGFLALGPKLSEKRYNDTDLALMVTLANQGAIALANAKRFQAEQDQARAIAAILQVGQALGSMLDLEPLLERIGVEACKALKADRWLLARFDAQAGRHFVQHEVGLSEADLSATRSHLSVAQPMIGSGPYFWFSPERAAGVARWAAIAVLNADLYDRSREALRELEQTQESLALADKLAALGKLASGVAHELNTPLAIIRGQLQLVEGGLPREDLDRISRQLGRMERIVADLPEFGRPSPAKFEAIPLAPVVDGVISFLQLADSRYSRVQVPADYPAEPPLLWGNPDRLEQMFLNLVTNACDATAGLSDPRVGIGCRKVDDFVVVTVEDNGCGISQDNLGLIFDPFFTTKDIGSGTGLGLSVTFGILKEHGGWIEVDSRPGEGTKMMLGLPIAVGAAVPAA